MNKIILNFLYLCNIISAILTASTIIASSIDNSAAGLYFIYGGIEIAILVITFIYVIIYSKKIKNN